MASGEPTQDAPGLHATRQMLDELDALMERMLALPVNETDEAAAAPAIAAPAAPSPAPPMAAPMTAKLTLLQVPVDEPSLDAAHAGTNPSHLPALGAVRSAEPPRAPRAPRATTLPPLPQASPMAPPPLSGHVVPPAEQPTVESLWAEVPEADDSVVSWFIVPLLWGNRAYDQATLYLGPPGAWLRSATGRALLGLMGLLLLAAAGLWLVRDW
jgi:hypothetical protein